MVSDDNFKKLADEYAQLRNKNDLLEKFTKKRILDNAQIVRTLKDTQQKELGKYKSAIVNLQSTLKDQTNATNKLNKDVNTLKKYSKELKSMNNDLQSEVSVLKEYSTSFETLFEAQIQRAKLEKKSIIFVMAGIDNYNYLEDVISKFTTIDRFTLGIYKFMQSRLNSDDIVYYHEAGTYFISIIGKTLHEVEQDFIKIGRKKVIHDNNITISSSISLLKATDTWDIVMERALSSFSTIIGEGKTSQLSIV